MTIKSKLRPEDLRQKLKELLDNKSLIRVIEVHNGASSLVANNVKLELDTNCKKEVLEFDALWASSLTDSASKGLPDIEVVSLDSRLNTIEQIISVTTKPVIVDGDTGGDPASFEYFINRLERLGVSAIIIEDKTFPKRNSLDANSIQNLEDPDVFAEKIKIGKETIRSKDFLIFARIESLIAGCNVEDAIFRAEKYLQAGADGILIHSRETNPVRVMKFAIEYDKLCEKLGFSKPLLCIPTTYNTVREKELKKHGFRVVIYANHLLRTSVKSMEDVCKIILLKGRAFETEPHCTPVSKILDMVGFTQIRERDRKRLSEQSKAKVIILAAGKPKETIVEKMPTAMLDVNGKTVIQRQLDVLRRCGIVEVTVVRGYEREKINVNSVKYSDVKKYGRGSLFSLLTAREGMEDGFILIFSDILFDESVITMLLKSREDIVIVADASYPFHRHEIDKELDLIIGKHEGGYHRELSAITEKEVSFIGKKIRKEIATHEFIGIAKFSKYGAQNLINVYGDCLQSHKGKFHENKNFEEASIVDMLQEMIEREFKIHYIETNKGWMEIHNKKDYAMAKEIIY